MEYFGITLYGPQNSIQDLLRPGYWEPMRVEEVKPLMDIVKKNDPYIIQLERPDTDTIRLIDCYVGRVNGFAYGSIERFNKMKKKGVIKPVGPADMYRIPPSTSVEIGCWLSDKALANKTWYITDPRFPQPASPNTLVLDKAKKNNKYATLF